MFRKLLLLTVTVALMAALLPAGAPALAQGPAASGTAISNLNVRTGPGMQYDIIHVLSEGDMVTLIARNWNFSWAKVRCANGVVGWVSTYYIQIVNPPTDLPIEDQ